MLLSFLILIGVYFCLTGIAAHLIVISVVLAKQEPEIYRLGNE